MENIDEAIAWLGLRSEEEFVKIEGAYFIKAFVYHGDTLIKEEARPIDKDQMMQTLRDTLAECAAAKAQVDQKALKYNKMIKDLEEL
mgnify:CR=1 FL=1